MDEFGEIEKRSHKLLGGYHRLAFAASVAGLPPAFKTAEIVTASSMTPTAVSKGLKHFDDAGLLQKKGHGRWLRLHDAFWQGCAAVLDALEQEFGPPPPPAKQSVARRRRNSEPSSPNPRSLLCPATPTSVGPASTTASPAARPGPVVSDSNNAT